MSKSVVTWGVILAIFGLVVGYLIFGRLGGEYIGLGHLFSPAEGWLEEIGETITGVKEARQNILISGAVGLGLGILVGALTGRGRTVS